MIEAVLNRIVREIVVGVASFTPPARRRQIRRFARGREDARNLRKSDYAIVSFGKSGRTWLNVMLSRFFQLRFKLPEDSLLSFDNLHGMNRAIPKILFTHDNYIRDYTGDGAAKASFYNKPTVLLVRHPGDVTVSQFFQWRYRMHRHKKILNDYPPHGADVSIFDFTMHEKAGLEKAVRFMNEWAKELPKLHNCLVVRYEDMRSNTKTELNRILTWMGQNPTEAEVTGAVDFASFDNLKKLEDKQVFKTSGKRMMPGEKGNPDSYKVRRAKVGGYRDYFTDEQVLQIDAYIREHLDPIFGYKFD